MKRAIIIAVIIFISFVGFGIYKVEKNYKKINSENTNLNQVDFITAQRIINYQKKIFTYTGIFSSTVTEGVYDIESKNLYLNCLSDGSAIAYEKNQKVYVYIEKGDLNVKKDEVVDFNKYKNSSKYIYFTGDEYTNLLKSYGCNL